MSTAAQAQTHVQSTNPDQTWVSWDKSMSVWWCTSQLLWRDTCKAFRRPTNQPTGQPANQPTVSVLHKVIRSHYCQPLHCNTGNTQTCVNAIRSDTSSAVTLHREEFSQRMVPLQKQSQYVNPKMIQRQQGVSGLTHPVDAQSTFKPNGSGSRRLC